MNYTITKQQVDALINEIANQTGVMPAATATGIIRLLQSLPLVEAKTGTNSKKDDGTTA